MTRSERPHTKAVRVSGVRIEYDAPSKKKRFRSSIEGRAKELPQDGMAMARIKRSSKRATVTFGSVTIKGSNLPAEEMQRNVASGHAALKRAAKAFVKAGVTLRRGRNVPLYRADPKEPRILIRELNGRSERGTFVGGEFKLAE